MAMGPRERRCRFTGCGCSHETCDRGWLDRLDERGNTVGTTPCGECRPALAGAVLLASDRDSLRRNLAAYRQGRTVEPDPEPWYAEPDLAPA